MSGGAAIKSFSQPFWAVCVESMWGTIAPLVIITIMWECFALMHIIILFLSFFFPLSLCNSLPSINLPFMPCLPQKFLPHHVCEHLTQHIRLRPRWEHGVLESFNITFCRAVSWDSSGCSRPDVPFRRRGNAPTPGADRTRQTPLPPVQPCSRSKVTFYTPWVGTFKGIFFLRAFQCRPPLFCEVKLKLMTDMTL